MRLPKSFRSFSRVRHEKGEKNETLIEGSFFLRAKEGIRLVGEFPRRVFMGDCLAFLNDRKILSPANGIVIFETNEDKNYLKITQDGGLEPPHEFQDVTADQNYFFNLLDKNGIFSLDFEDTPLVNYLKNFWTTDNSELILSPFSKWNSPNFQNLVNKDYHKEWELLLVLLEKIFPGKKIHNYWSHKNLKFAYPSGTPDYFSDRIAGFSILGKEPKDLGRIFYLGSETIWHLIRGLYYDLPFTRRHLSVYCVDKQGRMDGRERHFLLSNGQSFQFLKGIFAKEYEYYSLDHFYNPSNILSKNEEHYFDIFENSSVVFYMSSPKKHSPLPCTECNECNINCPTSANPMGLIAGMEEFEPKLCIHCGLCNLYCPSGIDLREKIMSFQERD
ncbi:MAG: hypothetical protein JJT78_17105 [Leptospira sp.]|nr:hypothetical protein [Leptospira sp.]